MSVTYGFIVSLLRGHAPPPARLLDFGCGAGEIVALALAAGFDAYGVDTYDTNPQKCGLVCARGWRGGRARNQSLIPARHRSDSVNELAGWYEAMWQQYAGPARVLNERLLGDRILRVPPGAALPFPDASFDAVVSNQVFEHIPDLGPVAAELARVLAPGGLLVAVFPTREILVEPHLKAPLVHWFPPGSASQRAALHASHALGLCNRPGQSRRDWVAEERANLQHHIFHRRVSAAIAALSPWFALTARGEAAFLRHRLALHPRLAPAARLPRLFNPLLARLTLRLANAVLILRRRDHSAIKPGS